MIHFLSLHLPSLLPGVLRILRDSPISYDKVDFHRDNLNLARGRNGHILWWQRISDGGILLLHIRLRLHLGAGNIVVGWRQVQGVVAVQDDDSGMWV